MARALVVEPEVLLLDEPLSNLDANLREEMRLEIRRLHEEFHITTLYVTHDQAEAMVISDRIAVLQQGRVVQVGTADELFSAPRTRFVAEFIGRANLVEAMAESADVMARGRLRLRVAARLEPGTRVAVCIRPHQIELRPARGEEAAAGSPNVLRGMVRRASFLGDSVDYEIAVSDSDVILRATTAPATRIQPGELVALHIAPADCIPLAAE